MAARIEIEQMGDPAQQKKMTAAVQALDGVIETKIEKGARLRSQIRKARVQTC